MLKYSPLKCLYRVHGDLYVPPTSIEILLTSSREVKMKPYVCGNTWDIVESSHLHELQSPYNSSYIYVGGSDYNYASDKWANMR